MGAAVFDGAARRLGRFGGLDVLVSNAGFFPANETIDNLSADNWENSLSVNLTAPPANAKGGYPVLRYMRSRRLWSSWGARTWPRRGPAPRLTR